MRHALLGLTALVLLALGVVVAFQHPEGGAVFAGACIRVGLLLGALWLALPQIAGIWQRTPKWLLIVAGVALVICVIHPLYAIAAVPLVTLLWLFGPRLTGLLTKAAKAKAPADGKAAADPPPAAPAPRPRRRANAR
jgi:hypothetical protein